MTCEVVVMVARCDDPARRFFASDANPTHILFVFVLFALLFCSPVVALLSTRLSSVFVFFFLCFCGIRLISAVPLLSHLPLPSVESWVQYGMCSICGSFGEPTIRSSFLFQVVFQSPSVSRKMLTGESDPTGFFFTSSDRIFIIWVRDV